MITPAVIESCNLENMKLEVRPQDIPVDKDVDIEAVYNMAPEEVKPDIFIWIESVEGYFPKNIKKLKIPTACYLIDSHIALQHHIEWSGNFDKVFIAQKEYLDAFAKAGRKNVYWMPLGCDPEIHNKNRH